jgi:4-carboxymuconolactone decarboxylase
MSESKWVAAQVAFQNRMPPLPAGKMTDAQRKAAEEMIAGPRKGVKGPFVPLLRSPELMDRLQKVGEYLRFQSSLEQRISEFIMLVVSREWTQHFEWFVHVPLGRKAGISEDTIAALAEGRRPSGMSEDEEIAYDFCEELLRTKGVSETTYRRAVMEFGENGVIDMIGVAGYFTTVSMVMNVAHSPPQEDKSVTALLPYPF